MLSRDLEHLADFLRGYEAGGLQASGDGVRTLVKLIERHAKAAGELERTLDQALAARRAAPLRPVAIDTSDLESGRVAVLHPPTPFGRRPQAPHLPGGAA